jgi:hypothetical protein
LKIFEKQKTNKSKAFGCFLLIEASSKKGKGAANLESQSNTLRCE